MKNRLGRWLAQHPLFDTLFSLKGNPRACTFTEPLWGIPSALYTPYMTVFMYALGLGDVEIGLVISIGLVFQVFTALLGGIITDRLGRRLTTFIFDILSWSVPVLIWMFADSLWMFVAAAIANSFWQITNNSWTCLLVEDAPQDKLVDIFTWATIAGLLSIFFAPIAALLIERYGLVPAMRAILAFTFISMTTKFVILFFYTKETVAGARRKQELINVSLGDQLRQYGPVIRDMMRDRKVLFILALMILIQISNTATASFFSLYVTENLGVAKSFLSYFPLVRAGIMFVLIFGIQTRLNRLPFRIPLGIGLSLYGVSMLILIFAPTGRLWILFVYTAFEALAYSLVIPQRDTLLTLFLDENERARQLSLIDAAIVAVSSPFGLIAGLLSSVDRRLPFALNFIFYALCLFLVMPKRRATARLAGK